MATNNEAQVQDIEIRLSEKSMLVMLEEVLTGIHRPSDFQNCVGPTGKGPWIPGY